MKEIVENREITAGIRDATIVNVMTASKKRNG